MPYCLIFFAGIRSVYIFGILLNCVSTAAAAFSNNIIIVFISGAANGIIYATLVTLPFILLDSYHTQDKKVSPFF